MIIRMNLKDGLKGQQATSPRRCPGYGKKVDHNSALCKSQLSALLTATQRFASHNPALCNDKLGGFQ